MEELALLDDDRRLLDGDRGRRLDPVEHERVTHLLDVVEDVVEPADQAVDVLAVERGDERSLEPMADVVADLVAAVLGVAELGRPTRRGRRRCGASPRASAPRSRTLAGVLDEHVEEALLARDDPNPHVTPLLRRRRRPTLAHPAGPAPRPGRVRCCERGHAGDRVHHRPGDRARGSRSPWPSSGAGPSTASASSWPGRRTTRRVPIDPEGVDVEQGVRVLLDRTKAAEWTDDPGRARPGGARSTSSASASSASTTTCGSTPPTSPPTSSSGRAPGSLVGRSAIEAFIDPTIEAVVETARESGPAGGELTLRTRRRADARRPGPPVAESRGLARPGGRVRAPPAPADPGRVHRQPVARAADAADDGQPAGRDARPRGRRRRRGDPGPDARPDRQDRGRDRPPRPDGRGAARPVADRVAAAPWSCSTRSTSGGSRSPRSSDSGCSPSGRASSCGPRSPEVVPPVRGAEDRLGQVLVNLLHNAVKFSPDGGEVVVRVAPTDEEVVVSVEDHGIGIPKADQARIFERFYKADKARRRGGGTGLGLAIARHVVEAPRRPDPGRVGGGPGLDVLVRAADPRPGRGLSRDGPPPRRHAQHPQPGRSLGRSGCRSCWPTSPRSSPTSSGSRRSSTRCSRTGSSAPPGRASTGRSAAGPADPSTATRCSSGPVSSRPTSTGSTSGSQRSAHRVRLGAARRGDASSSPSPTSITRSRPTAERDAPGGGAHRLARRGAGRRCARSSSATSTPTRASRPTPG